jgi:hypothetical protein
VHLIGLRDGREEVGHAFVIATAPGVRQLGRADQLPIDAVGDERQYARHVLAEKCVVGLLHDRRC